jgi:hypothetical protein
MATTITLRLALDPEELLDAGEDIERLLECPDGDGSPAFRELLVALDDGINAAFAEAQCDVPAA